MRALQFLGRLHIGLTVERFHVFKPFLSSKGHLLLHLNTFGLQRTRKNVEKECRTTRERLPLYLTFYFLYPLNTGAHLVRRAVGSACSHQRFIKVSFVLCVTIEAIVLARLYAAVSGTRTVTVSLRLKCEVFRIVTPDSRLFKKETRKISRPTSMLSSVVFLLLRVWGVCVGRANLEDLKYRTRKNKTHFLLSRISGWSVFSSIVGTLILQGWPCDVLSGDRRLFVKNTYAI